MLSESTRRRVYESVRAEPGSASRDDVARRTGLNRRLAAFHLDRLAAAGLLTVEYARPDDRPGGPGAGRPAKRYALAPVEIDLSVPRRSYDLAARVLATGIARSPGAAVEGALAAARDEGLAAGRRSSARPRAGSSANVRRTSVRTALGELGYEPTTDSAGDTRLSNCPFRSVADVAAELICGMNRELVDGLVEGLGARPAEVVLEPQEPPACCVTVRVRDRA